MLNLTIGVLQVPPIFTWYYNEDQKIRTNFKPINRVFDFFEKGSILLVPRILQNSEGFGTYTNGQWNGLLGMMSRNEVETTLSLICLRFKQLPGEPIVLPQLNEDYIVTAEQEGAQKKVPLLQSFKVIKLEIFIWLIITFLFAGLIISVIKFEAPKKMKTLIIGWIYSCWMLLKILFSELSLKFINFKLAIVTVSYLFLIFQLHAFFTSLFSTNLILQTESKKIESIEDIEENNLIPLLIEGESITTVIMEDRVESFGKFRDYILSVGVEKCIMEYNIPKISNLVTSNIYNVAIVASYSFFKLFVLNPTIGVFSSAIVEGLVPYVSKEPVSSCLHVPLIRTQSAIKRKLFIDLCAIYYESGFFQKTWIGGIENLVPTSWEQKHINHLTSTSSPVVVSFNEIKSLLLAQFVLFISTFLILLCEIVWKNKKILKPLHICLF